MAQWDGWDLRSEAMAYWGGLIPCSDCVYVIKTQLQGQLHNIDSLKSAHGGWFSPW
jgi:hypothetical protein